MLDYIALCGEGRTDHFNVLRLGKRKNEFMISLREEGMEVWKLKHSTKNLEWEWHWYSEKG